MTIEYNHLADINISKHDDKEARSWVKNNSKGGYYIRPDTFESYGNHSVIRRVYFEDASEAKATQERYPL